MDSNVQSVLLVINDGPYGSERPYNALRLALSLVKRPDVAVRVFLVGDGVSCARCGQAPSDEYYNIEHMVKTVAQHGEVAY